MVQLKLEFVAEVVSLHKTFACKVIFYNDDQLLHTMMNAI